MSAAERAQAALAAALLASLRRLPLSAAHGLARRATLLLDKGLPKLRRAARINLAFAYPQSRSEWREHIIDGVFATLARLLVSVSRFPDLHAQNISEWIGYEGLENYHEAKQGGRGVLIATAHFGNWELSAFAHALMCEQMNIMVRPLDNSAIDKMVEGRRRLSGNRLIFKWDGARAVLRALRNNEAVGILIDQNTSASEGVFVDFFGKPACAGSAFAKFAHHSGAAVVPGFAFWSDESQRYVLRFLPALPMSGDVTEDTAAIHKTIESVIREHPEQWMWIHRRWKTRPPGETAIY